MASSSTTKRVSPTSAGEMRQVDKTLNADRTTSGKSESYYARTVLIFSLLSFGCRYVNGNHYLFEKYHSPTIELETMLDLVTNTAINFAFPGAIILVNMIWYLVPLPAFVKAKFRE